MWSAQRTDRVKDKAFESIGELHLDFEFNKNVLLPSLSVKCVPVDLPH